MGFLQDLYGRKPVVPELPGLTLPEEQQKALDANISAAPKAAELARLSQEQIRDMMRFAIPGFDASVKQASGNIFDLLQGKIPGDVAAMTRIGSAGKSLAGGYASGRPGSMGSNLEARDLGLTSLGLTQQGLSSMESWLGAMERLYSPSQALYSSMFITPQQEFAASTQERDLQFQRSWLSNQVQAMPDPTIRGLYDTTMEIVSDVLGAYSGGGSHQSYQPNYGKGGGGGFGGGSGGAGDSYNIWGWGGGSSSGGGSNGSPLGGRGDLGDFPVGAM